MRHGTPLWSHVANASWRDKRIRDIVCAESLRFQSILKAPTIFASFRASKECRCPSYQPRGKSGGRYFSPHLFQFLQAHPYPRWPNNPRINNQLSVRPQAQLSTEQPLQRLLLRVSSRPPFVRSKVIIQAQCSVIIGGTTAVTSAISRVIISWSRPIIAIINYTAIASCLIPFTSVPGPKLTLRLSR
jgi:hypothetical protein